MQILIDIPDEQIKKSLEESKHIHEDEGEKGSVCITMLYTNARLDSVDVERKTDFYSCKYKILPKEKETLVIAPTEKQVKYAKYLAHRMCQDLPKEYTKQAYSDFISKWKPAVLAEDAGMNEPDAWRMQYM